MPEPPPLSRLLRRVLRLFGRRRTIHVTVPRGERSVVFAADQDGFKAGDRIVVHWEGSDEF